MKVFALGIEDKKQSDLDEKCETKIPIDTPLSASPQPPQIVIAKPPKRRYGFTCGVLSWFLAAFCIVLLCLAISEVTYHRQRDQAFLRLKWAELRQRMLGYELLSQQQDLDRLSLEQSSAKEVLPQKSIDPPKPEIMKSFPKNPDEESGSEEVSMRENDKATFLRTLVDALRRNAEKLGLSGDMQVHVVELQPMDEKEEPITFDRSIADGFGEVAMPRPFGPWQAANDYENSFEDHIDYEEPKFNEFLNQPQADGGWWGNQGNQHQMKMVQQPTVQNPPFFIFPQQFSQQQQMHQAQQFPAPFPLPQETQREPHPWYMNQQQIPSIFNEEKQQFPFNPHPIGALTLDHPKPEWIDNTVTVNTNDNRPPHFPRFQPNSVDINSDASPETVSSDAVVDENNNIPDSVKAWIQPQNDEQDEHVITPDPTLETIDDGKFLPIRTEDQKVDSLDDAVMDPSHFLQIDDPKAYAQDN